jgi:hypothetical protein
VKVNYPCYVPESPAALSRSDLPSIYRVASDHSARGQRTATRWLAAQLILLGFGAVLGAVDGVDVAGVHLGSASAAGALLISLVPAAWLAARNPQRAWYEGRAAAESVKTLAWKYAVRAEPFTGNDTTASTRLEADFAAICSEVESIDWPEWADQITPSMQALRQAGLEIRKEAYRSGRIEIERRWYAGKAASYQQANRRWNALAIGATAVGLTSGFLKAWGVMSYDGLGAASAIAAGATALLQMKQFRPLVAAYGLTGRDLTEVQKQLERAADEQEWAQRAAGAEDAISREHTMWLARREAA